MNHPHKDPASPPIALTSSPHSPPSQLHRPAINASMSTPLLASVASLPTYTPTTASSRKGKGKHDASSMDPHSLDALLHRWMQAVATKMRTKRSQYTRALKARKRAQQSTGVVPIISSVFEPLATDPLSLSSSSSDYVRTLDHVPPTSLKEFSTIIQSVRRAFDDPEKPMHPRLNKSGSSGSYFCRRYMEDGSTSETVGIFKPKDEEPYGTMNPKWTKWAHRVILAPVIGNFGRSCLIPNLSYLSEAAASLLDRRLQTFIVPRTEVVDFSSPSFFYSWHQKQAASRKWKPKPLPAKAGSFQVFAHGFEDASATLKSHPWPGRSVSDTLDEDVHRQNPSRHCGTSLYHTFCGGRRAFEEEEEILSPENAYSGHLSTGKKWRWTQELMDDFRVEMEKLVILDFLMRNTDRGLDNFMIKVCNATSCRRQPVGSNRSHPSSTSSTLAAVLETEDDKPSPAWMSKPHCHVAAIDNSLAFPHHHPRGWRAYPYGWLFLPVSLIGQPFSQSTRDHFLPLLSSPLWWAETTLELRQLFATDSDFNEKMFERQMSLIKGQGWNVVESLKHVDEGPLELCRRSKLVIWDDPIEVNDDAQTQHLIRLTSTPIKTSRGTDLNSYIDQKAPTSTTFDGSGLTTYGTLPMQIPTLNRSWTEEVVNESDRRRPLPAFRGMKGMRGDFSGARGVDLMRLMEMVEAQEQNFSKSLGMTFATEHSSLSIREEEDEEEDEGGSYPWGSFSEGDVRQSQSQQPLRSPWLRKVKSRLGGSWKKKTKGMSTTKSRLAQPKHRRTTSTNDTSIMYFSKDRPVGASDGEDGEEEEDDDEEEGGALSEGGGDVGSRWASLDEAMTSSTTALLARLDESNVFVAVRERVEWVSDKATFMC